MHPCYCSSLSTSMLWIVENQNLWKWVQILMIHLMLNLISLFYFLDRLFQQSPTRKILTRGTAHKASSELTSSQQAQGFRESRHSSFLFDVGRQGGDGAPGCLLPRKVWCCKHQRGCSCVHALVCVYLWVCTHILYLSYWRCSSYTGTLYNELRLLWMVENGNIKPHSDCGQCGQLLVVGNRCHMPSSPIACGGGDRVHCVSTNCCLFPALATTKKGAGVFGAAFNPAETTSPSSSWWHLQLLSLAADIESDAPLFPLCSPPHQQAFILSLSSLILPASIPGAARPMLMLGRREERQILGHRKGGGLEKRPHQGTTWRRGRGGGRGLIWWGREKERDAFNLHNCSQPTSA